MATRDDLSARDKLRAYFLSNLSKVLDSGELRKVAGISEWARRIRELRDEEGYQILTHNDRSDLKPGQYVLFAEKPIPAIARSISKETRALILDRNGFTCQMCGAAAGEPHPFKAGQKTRLHIGHIIDISLGGSDDPLNLRAICSVCNEGASNVTADRPSSLKLVTQVRRATAIDQVEVMTWLVNKYRAEAKKLIDD